MAGEWDGDGGSLGLLSRTTATEPAHMAAGRTKTRKVRLEVKKRPLTARTLLAALGRPGGSRGRAETPTEQRERPTIRRPARRVAAAAAAADADAVSGATGAAPSRESSPGRSPAGWAGPPSPAGSPSDALQRRLRRLDRAKLYLLEQPGPHSFLLATDTPGHKYRVTLGPQSCSCSRSSLCVHLLFVMIRVLRLSATDYRVTCHTLKTHEVEALLQTYRRRRLSRVSNLPCGDTPTNSDPASEERRCPICQMQMTPDQSLVRCEEGCHSFLHHRCMSVWTVEAASRQEATCCPLCRAAWSGPLTPLVRGVWSEAAAAAAAASPPGSGTPASSPNTPSTESPPLLSSPTPTSSTANTPSTPSNTAPPLAPPGWQPSAPHSHASTPTSHAALLSALPATHTAGAASPPASPLVARARLSGLCSPGGERALRRGSVEPEVARSPQLSRRAAGRGSLRRPAVRLERLESVERRQVWSQVLGRDLVHLVFSRDWQIRDNGISRLAEALNHIVESPGGRSAADLVHQVADLLAVLCADPVYKVFYGAIKCLHVLLRSVSCCSSEEAAELRNSLTPLVDALLLRSTDTNRRTGQLSAWTLAELVRGPTGELLAAELDGLQLVLDRLLQECRSGADSWQWCLGRLLVADYLVDQFKERFGAMDTESAGRVVRLAEFAHRALTHPHATVSQLAHRVFVQMALAARAAPAAHTHIDGLLAALDTDVRLRLVRRIRGKSGVRPARRGRSSTGAATPRQPAPEDSPAPAGNGGRRPRPTYLPLPGAGTAVKRKCSPLPPPAAGERSASLRPRHAATAASSAGQPVYESSAPVAMELGEEPSVPSYLMTAAANSVKDIVVHPQTQDMEGGTCDTYTEELNWQRGPLLGQGSFSTCYQARDLRFGRLMAVKQVQLSTEAGSADEEALLQEVHLLARLQHPHVLSLLVATRRPGLVCLFTEWEAGGSVSGLLDLYGPFEGDVIRRYTSHLVDGLAYLHDNNVLHGDLKGANLLVDSRGLTLRIGDLGTAARLGAASTLRGELSGQEHGTVAYMAPEALRGQQYNRSCDVWSVGCCVIEMASGRPPWDAHTYSNRPALLFMIANSLKPPEVPHELPDDLRELVTDCHRLDGDKRPSTHALLNYPCFKTVPDF